MANNSAILKTLTYSDVFDFPLTKEELWRFLIAANINRASFEKTLTEFPLVKWEHEKGFYFLSGRGEIVEKRIKRKKESQKKLNFARKIIEKLSLVPTVLFIGISGGLAIENAEKDDDIDLFVITAENTLWITRLILILILIFMGKYRRKYEKEEANKICLNMLIDEGALDLSKRPHFDKASRGKQDIYTAHEIIQLRPMFDRNNTYNKFLNENRWVVKFLPNFTRGIKPNTTWNHAESLLSIILRTVLRFSALENPAKVLQLWYMKKHRTKETIESHFLAFHPFDYRDYVLKEYNKRLKRYEV